MHRPGQPTLYVIDDEPDQAFLIQLAAERCGEFGVIHSSSDPLLAFHHLVDLSRRPEDRPDLILTDWRMSPMSGAELVSALRGHPEVEEIPIIALSGSNFRVDEEAALAAGCRAFFQKPSGFTQLVTLLREIRRVLYAWHSAA